VIAGSYVKKAMTGDTALNDGFTCRDVRRRECRQIYGHEVLKTSWPLAVLLPVRQDMENLEVTKSAWASPAPWVEVVARRRGW
jgi:hypothetical protein